MEGDRERDPAEHAQLRALRPRRSGASGTAVPGNRECGIRFVRRRRELAAAADEPAARAGVLAHRPGRVQRSRHRDVRPRVLDPGRRHAAQAAHAGRAERGRASVPASNRVPVARHHGAVQRAERSDRGTGRAVRRVDQLLPEVRRDRTRYRQDRERERTGRAGDRRRAARRRQPPLLGSSG